VQDHGPKSDECMILIKAQPHRSSKYTETVCCAGVGRDRKWRRQYPVPFRILGEEQKFRRWQWIEYKYVPPAGTDPRHESQRVQQDTLVSTTIMKPGERANFLAPLVKVSTAEADEAGESLALIRPQRIALRAHDKPADDLAYETREHRKLADQGSLFGEDREVQPFKPCRKRFTLDWTDQLGKSHTHVCDDWETVTAFERFDRLYGEDRALRDLRQKYEQQYFEAGLVLGFSTHSRRNVEYGTRNQWLLVGLIRLDETKQGDLLA